MRHVSRQQWEALRDQLGRVRHYLRTLRERVVWIGMPGNDRFHHELTKAIDGVHALWVFAHYNSVGSGVGGNEEPAAPEKWLGDGI